MILKTKLFGHVYEFKSIREVMAKANEEKSGDKLAGIAAETAEERVAAKVVLSNLTLNDLRNCPAVPYEEDEVTRIIQDSVNETIFNEYRLGPERACAQGWISPQAMKTGIIITVALACLIGCTLLFFAGWELIIVGVLCVLFAFLYTTGPYPLSYNGWGDVLVIVFFGFVPVGGTYYVQALTWTPDVTIASLICGLLIDTLLVVNNYRDREADARSGKRTVIVRFGEKFGRYFYLMLGITASLLCLCFLREGHFYAAFLPQLYLIPHFLTWKRMVKIYSGKKLNSILGETSRNMLLMGILIAIGMLIN